MVSVDQSIEQEPPLGQRYVLYSLYEATGTPFACLCRKGANQPKMISTPHMVNARLPIGSEPSVAIGSLSIWHFSSTDPFLGHKSTVLGFLCPALFVWPRPSRTHPSPSSHFRRPGHSFRVDRANYPINAYVLYSAECSGRIVCLSPH